VTQQPGNEYVDVREHEQARADVGSASVGDLLGNVVEDVTALVRQEIELARAELEGEAKKAGRAAGMFGAAGVAGWMFALFASLALMWTLNAWMPLGWAALIVAVLWAVAGAVAYARGKTEVRSIRGPQQTIETVKEDVQWARTRSS
jgi:uncharacterized membrane protein YqjE